MKTTLGLLIFFPLFVQANAVPKGFESGNKLSELWHGEDIYFLPKDKSDLLNWSGVIYHYPTKRCYGLEQKDPSGEVVARESKCESAFVKKATEPYTKISDFEKYKARLLTCLDQLDEKCIRGLVSKTLQVSFGVDGLQDRRDYIFENWKKKDFKRLHDLIKEGTLGEGESRSFPPRVANEGMGYRGEFKKENDGWLLKSFLAGD